MATGTYQLNPNPSFINRGGSSAQPVPVTDPIDMDLLIEQYGGEVEGTILNKSFMRNFVTVKGIRGTNTIKNDRIGASALQKVIPGVRPQTSTNAFAEVSVTVDTTILARAQVDLLGDFQMHYDVRMELGQEQGKQIGKFYDEAHIIQAIKCAGIGPGIRSTVIDGDVADTPDGTGNVDPTLDQLDMNPSEWKGGTVITLASAGDEEDSGKLQRGIEDMCEAMEEKEVDLSEGAVILLAPKQYYTLLRNDKLINSQYSLGNGDYAQGEVLRSCGIPIFKTTRIPTAAITGHFLSNANNNNSYDVTAAEAKTKVILMLPKALLSGETIPVTSNIYYVDTELQWNIDSYLAFGVTGNRGEYCAILQSA